MTLKELRKKCNFTQAQAAQFLKMPLRTYHRYETDKRYSETMKYLMMLELMEDKCHVDETHGKISVDVIKEVLADVLGEYDVKSCYLFGSYAKDNASETSDVDLLIDSNVTGLDYFGLLQRLIDNLHKNVDLVRMTDATANPELMSEILKDGIKVYG